MAPAEPVVGAYSYPVGGERTCLVASTCSSSCRSVLASRWLGFRRRMARSTRSAVPTLQHNWRRHGKAQHSTQSATPLPHLNQSALNDTMSSCTHTTRRKVGGCLNSLIAAPRSIRPVARDVQVVCRGTVCIFTSEEDNTLWCWRGVRGEQGTELVPPKLSGRAGRHISMTSLKRAFSSSPVA